MKEAATTPPHPDPGVMSQDPVDVLMGRVDGVFGLQGEVRLYLYNPDTPVFQRPRDVAIVGSDGVRRAAWLTVRPGAGKRILGRIRGVETPEAAADWVGGDIFVPRAELPPLETDAWYHRDLIGVPVTTVSGRSLGVLTEISDHGEVDIWVCVGPDGERYVPALRANLVEVTPGVRVVVRDDLAE
jgi:16S rRNA processing protein RimM